MKTSQLYENRENLKKLGESNKFSEIGREMGTTGDLRGYSEFHKILPDDSWD